MRRSPVRVRALAPFFENYDRQRVVINDQRERKTAFSLVFLCSREGGELSSYGLTDAKVRSLKPEAAHYALNDIRGLYLDVMPSGRKFWRMRYTTSDGKRTWYTMGEYPAMSITDIKPRDVLAIMQRLAAQGKYDMMTRIRSIISMIFRYSGRHITTPTTSQTAGA